jgi:uncharacterized protein with PQ loop repeat
MSFQTTVGTLGALAFGALQVPQVRKVYREQSAEDLSWSFLGLHLVCSVLWFMYSVSIQEIPVILFSVFYGVSNIATIYMKRKYQKNPSTRGGHSATVGQV